MYYKLFAFALVLIALAFCGIAVKLFFSKKAEFKRSCSSIDPISGKEIGCSCGKEGKACKNAS